MKLLNVVCAICLLMLTGCSNSEPPPPPAASSGPLTVEEWKQMPAGMKYDGQSLERLRDSNPEFKDDQAWDQFMKEVFIAERKKDLPQQTPR